MYATMVTKIAGFFLLLPLPLVSCAHHGRRAPEVLLAWKLEEGQRLDYILEHDDALWLQFEGFGDSEEAESTAEDKNPFSEERQVLEAELRLETSTPPSRDRR